MGSVAMEASGVWNWINRNGQALTAFASMLALLGVLYQVHASEQAQRAQSARDIYREFVALTVNRPELALTVWSDTLPPERRAAYEAYVDYLLYASEQVIAVDAEWTGPMGGWLEDHAAFLCARDDMSAYTPAVQALIASVKAGSCP
jgi:hypothetical protein